VIENLMEAPLFRKYAPPVAGLIFIAAFVSLSLWQLDRAAEKEALLELFEGDAPYRRATSFESLEEFDRIQLDGRFLTERQILIDNIVLNSRPGYYVITPFKPNSNHPLLLVNRGWVRKTGSAGEIPPLGVDEQMRTVRGLVGHLPRVAIRPGKAFEGSASWPRVAVYPTRDEISAELDESLLPLLLLLAPDEEDGYVRQWKPNVSGPMTHYGYAFQWFAMAMAVVAILFWHLRKGLRRDTTTE
jgi:cytochrome oxidase assembly protein ShyY1